MPTNISCTWTTCLHIEHVLPQWELIKQHDNARPHVARIVNVCLEAEYVSILKQALYFPNTNLFIYLGIYLGII